MTPNRGNDFDREVQVVNENDSNSYVINDVNFNHTMHRCESTDFQNQGTRSHISPPETVIRSVTSDRNIRNTNAGTNNVDLERGDSLQNTQSAFSRFSRCITMNNFIVAALGIIICVFAFVQTRENRRFEKLVHRVLMLETKLEDASSEPKLCLPCYTLEQGPYPEDNPDFIHLDIRNIHGHNECCARTTSQMFIIFNLFTKLKFKALCGPGCNLTTGGDTNTSRPPSPERGAISAHLMLGEQPAEYTGDRPVRRWLGDRPGTFISGLNQTSLLTRGRALIPESGIYFLYSQVGFLMYYNASVPVDRMTQSFSHTVRRFGYLYAENEETLLMSRVTQCWERQKEFGRYSSYVGAAVALNQGDEVYVKVSNVEHLSHEETWGYFGLHKIA